MYIKYRKEFTSKYQAIDISSDGYDVSIVIFSIIDWKYNLASISWTETDLWIKTHQSYWVEEISDESFYTILYNRIKWINTNIYVIQSEVFIDFRKSIDWLTILEHLALIEKKLNKKNYYLIIWEKILLQTTNT